ncbi:MULTISPECIES: SMP-30/gluconolactonase/LRE family protein [Streptomyces]|uniref:Sugar lactone lactonase YvrE n=1 Tax=Streptomyces clavifer TaxID=68188 RepID=A0ABS4V233_9ACTN|nr:MULTISPECIES: SMP-30/gluconolactonase/LRE family protein [Streptomyces]KQX93116.1 calcium-binding protein [Streptomyces sp. Root1319]KQZ17222.1 calcium-binding protein [Streptomyces sp. Root55]MBP2357975.1 sugar lactone lactonase YvrE [Streptomyces clavifer]MDX2742358.1 SMP-30/gluconolactonase/LRE family protein [Streptomyces sp. NRRL_B-2557]MDX3067905.1 SMP-30/gluconolactonase/LRE family protein [Streptomyces sp. ND04-05B]
MRPGPEVAVRERAELGEGPTWDAAAGRLIWVDVLSSRVHTYDPADGRRTVTTTEQHVGAAKPRAGGGLVVNLRDGIGLYDADGTFSWLAREPVSGRRGNDAAVSPDGALWAGTMRYDEAEGGGNLSRFAPDGTATGVLDAVTVSNGTGWSPDGRLMYYIDTPTLRIDVFDVDGERVLGRRPFAVVEPGSGWPDGLTVDADGCVWVAFWDGAAVRRYAPDGRVDRIVHLPVRRPTACVFGGAGLRDLYISTARTGLDAPHPLSGSLLVLPDAGRGLPGVPFAG